MENKALYILAGYDEQTEVQLTGIQNKLYEQGFVGSHTKNIPMHITLGKLPTEMEEELKDMLLRMAKEVDPFEVNLSHVGLFTGGWVLFIAPNVNEKLQNLKERFGEDPAWTPHTTMLIDKPEVIVDALPVVIKEFQEFKGTITSLHLYEFFPTRHILTVDFE